MIKIIVNGYNGKMGQAVVALVDASEDCALAFGADLHSPITNAPHDADVIIDFSNPASLPNLLSFAKLTKTPLVLATTGYSESEIKQIEIASRDVAILRSATMSLGINILLKLAAQTTKILQNSFDIEVIEKHHNKKIDAPSGVALTIANTVAENREGFSEVVLDRYNVRKPRENNEIGISSIRGGNIVGEHTVIFAGESETLEITHSATSREIFARGALAAARFLVSKGNGLYNMQDVINFDN